MCTVFCGGSLAVITAWGRRLTYERTVSSGLQPDVLSCFQLSFFHLRLGVPEGPGPAGSVRVGYLQQLGFVHHLRQLLLRQTV